MAEDTNPLKQFLRALEAQSARTVGQSQTSETATDVNQKGMEHNVPTGNSTYLPEVYEAERDLGFRRSNGAAKLKRLKPLHKKILALHLAAWPNDQIAEYTGKSASWISTIINDPLSQSVINTFEDMHEEEFKRLRALANSALRDALQPTKTDSTRLRAARIFYQKDGEVKAEKGETAEDVMSKILNRIEADNVQINFNLGGAS